MSKVFLPEGYKTPLSVYEMQRAIEEMGFEQTTDIQASAIPLLRTGVDVIGRSQTGTGKTAAYLLPILSMISDGGYPEDAINCVIMSPTRELAQQIDQALQGFSYHLPYISSVAVYGGNDGIRYEQEKRSMQQGADIVIATPGRLISHLSLGNIDLSRVSFFILDEADRMLDMGFSDDILQIAKHLPEKRQTIMFSATMPANIRKMAKAIMNNPAEVQIAVSRPPESIKQQAIDIFEPQKNDYLKLLLKERNLKKVIIFVGKKQRVKDLTRALRANNIDARAMHSDLEQKERDEVMLDFRNNKVDVLVATDIVSRGIDVDDIPLVINYDVPRDAEDYVHRIGRTARAENKGEAITLVSPEDKHFFNKIERFLQKSIERLPLPSSLGAAPDSSVCSLAADEPKRSSKHRKGGKPHWQKRKPNHNRPKAHKQ